ncbi:hypothetical protein C7W88_12840 [Novosphingobium sp. THN1]|uniref:hypothetical protein n=1 Tax=Novosphingobium sp. THN1 TaxID=1016987 RepID=UPI000E535240|nr:hypothetical protein [Novosphingobium sp. THN1]AXU19709.1 hypothetical protein C7W88_12840 [Novosphingobium sp. THN1]
MATHILDAFLVTFGLDTKEFEEGERDVTDRTKRLREEQRRSFTEIERYGKKTGEAIKGLSRDVIGLGLAFMGARSITGLISNMMTGAAVADRFGQTLGMNAKQVWAWRMAMKSVGGETAEGDAALSAVQGAKMGFRMGTMSPDQAAAYGRLGITGNDLRSADAGAILQKLAGAQGKMDPQLYASLLQQIGLPASTIYFLQQGKGSVDKLISQFEADAAGQEALAKEQEQLQKTMTELTTTIQKELVPPLTRIAQWLNGIMGAGMNRPSLARPGNLHGSAACLRSSPMAVAGLFQAPVRRAPTATTTPATSRMGLLRVSSQATPEVMGVSLGSRLRSTASELWKNCLAAT